ncbi:hypothetical protein GCM10010145_26580 [Streptomyces ruber]|uniref:STAS domain-containing protein n=2 Tax=Streptomyces TaxID=1883 RepID=A0A918BC66_9ACTN|nr:STAS domain-containing protein [Streptomyces ruber]GGQ55468.1 hypothetical protein GCM10010145_26580 [Streptomyces ruber]
MTAPDPEFSLIVTAVADVLRVEIAGDLDQTASEELVRAVAGHLTPGTAFRHLRLDFRQLTWIDSMGLAALLRTRRLTSTAGVRLRLDNRPGFLDRLLALTGTSAHLTASGSTGEEVTGTGTG